MNTLIVTLAIVAGANAHIGAWSKGMYCRNGLSNVDTPNIYYPVIPLVDLKFKDWFMHGQCRNYPPPPGEFMDLPAGGTFTVEMGSSRAFTTLSYNGTKTTRWPDGEDHPDNYGDVEDPRFPKNAGGCVSSPNIHAKNSRDVAGSAFAIAYKSDINQVTMDDLVVFTVLHSSPWYRVATFHVPKYLPKCPKEGCICAWGWVPNNCGQGNEYMLPYRCRVTNVSPNARALGKPQNPKWCEDDPRKCVKGPKKMSIGWQREGNTVSSERLFFQKDGQWRSNGYNMKLGFADGAQEDIYAAGSPAKTEKPTSSPPATETDKGDSDGPAVSQPTSPGDSSSLKPSTKRCSKHRSSLVRRAHMRRRALGFHH